MTSGEALRFIGMVSRNCPIKEQEVPSYMKDYGISEIIGPDSPIPGSEPRLSEPRLHFFVISDQRFAVVTSNVDSVIGQVLKCMILDGLSAVMEKSPEMLFGFLFGSSFSPEGWKEFVESCK